MENKSIPQSVRIRTGEGNEYRYHAIERLSNFYGVNKSEAVAKAGDQLPELVDVLEEIVAMDSLTMQQRKEIAQKMNSCRGLSVNVDLDVELDPSN